tara:strand:- start:2080 stop:2472 length:393 start_codon:yes stop_codon:yes gene_type:complete
MNSLTLTILFDGGCPLCKREISFLKSKDKNGYISFVDINSIDYKPELFSGISYRDAMKRIHAIKASGVILKDLNVFREAYKLVGFGWFYAPTSWPLFNTVFDFLYTIWARYRLTLTGRKSLDDLCKCRTN